MSRDAEPQGLNEIDSWSRAEPFGESDGNRSSPHETIQ